MAEGRFDYFVVLAGMRTGSNLLEEYLSAMPGLRSFGELFNPHFFGKPKQDSQLGFTIDERDRDPSRVVEALRGSEGGLPGFRLFYDHDQRVIDLVLADPRAAKIVLTRRPVDSYVSLKIARKTGQWWLGDMSSARAAKVEFDAEEYSDFLNTLSAFQGRIRHALQTTGQTAFHVDYDDLADQEVIAGLGRFLGGEGPPDASKVRAKVQNPVPAAERLTNAAEAEVALARLTTPDPWLIPSYEPERGPGMRMFHACAGLPLLYMPIRGAGQDPVPEWMAELDPEGQTENGMTQKDVRKWMRRHPGHRTFTVLRHPLPRAYDAFCRHVLPPGVDGYAEIRDTLSTRYGVTLPSGEDDWSIELQRQSFLAFLGFLAGNLGGQTSLRVDNSWASQAALLEAIARFKVPDRVVREEDLSRDLAQIAGSLGVSGTVADIGGFSAGWQYALNEIRTGEIDAACEAAYRRDYVFFGFRRWEPSP